jgi:hypothetical protein
VTLLLPEVELVAHPWMERGMWMARCPRLPLGCTNAEHYGPDPIGGHVGGLTDSGFRCARCHLECPAVWPRARRVIERLLAARPIPDTRNWMLGEPIKFLIAENIQHGLIRVERQ